MATAMAVRSLGPASWEAVVAVAIEVCVSIEKVRRLSVIDESRKSPWLVTVLGASDG